MFCASRFSLKYFLLSASPCRPPLSPPFTGEDSGRSSLLTPQPVPCPLKTHPRILLVGIFLLALALRLIVWHWRTFYPLGGDEQEYLQQALTLLQERRYVELRFMRPPLYGVFLAGCILLVDSLVQHLRLIQAIISAATVIPVWLLTREAVLAHNSDGTYAGRVGLLAALLGALSYTLAANATELLTETLFLFGLTILFWLLLRIVRHQHQTNGSGRWSAAAAGLVLGALCLTRSVALPLLPLGAMWLMLNALMRRIPTKAQNGTGEEHRHRIPLLHLYAPLGLFLLMFSLTILPWTMRNYVTYGGLILIDTTGAENLWLDNDPAGREAVKAQLYAMGDERLARQRLATQRGLAVIIEHPDHFRSKAWNELQHFFALEYSDDLRDRRAIWVPPAEVWMRLLLGDGVWLLLILGGSLGVQWAGQTERHTTQRTEHTAVERFQRFRCTVRDPRWLFVPWSLYILLTALLFHVELRYRLPLYPVLLPYTALLLAGNWPPARLQRMVALVLPASIVFLLLLHRPYPTLAWQLGWKHWHLAQAERALERGDHATARHEAQQALAHDPASALARIALARSALLADDQPQATLMLRDAIATLPAHPQAHLLLGDLLRQQGDAETARHSLGYETASLQDLQAWSWHWFTSPPPATLDVGGGLDLGWIRGFHAAESGDWRWTTGHATIRLAAMAPHATASGDQARILQLRLAAGRPPGTPAPTVHIQVEQQLPGAFQVASDWRNYYLLLPATANATPSTDLVVSLHSPTFTPRTYDRASDDGRILGVMVDRASVRCSKAQSASKQEAQSAKLFRKEERGKKKAVLRPYSLFPICYNSALRFKTLRFPLHLCVFTLNLVDMGQKAHVGIRCLAV